MADRRCTFRFPFSGKQVLIVFAAIGIAIVLFQPISYATTTAPIAPLSSIAGKALINGDSVTTSDGITDASGNPISLEQFAAQRAGYSVTVVTGAQWDAMTSSQFAQYQLLIVGDPLCGVTPASVVSNATTWAPVVMGASGINSLVGNRVVVGTDPEDHYLYGGGGAPPSTPGDPTTSGAEHLVQDGITYAGGVSGATGVYFDTSCSDPGSDVSVLNSLSNTGIGFTENTSPPCGGSVQIVASNPVFASLSDANIQGWSCSDHITFPTYPTDWQPLAIATDTTTTPTCGTDPNTKATACGQAYVLVAGNGIVVTSPNLNLTPSTSTSSAGGTHTVTATVTVGSVPIAGQLVAFSVSGQNNGTTGACAPASCLTNVAGQATFTYTDSAGPGIDTVNASVTVNGTTEHATASQSWLSGKSLLSYNGGPVMTDMNVHLIFWLPNSLQDGSTPNWGSTSESSYVSTIEQYFRDVGGSGLQKNLNQYYDTTSGSQRHIGYKVSFAGAVVDTDGYPGSISCSLTYPRSTNCVNDATVENVITAAIGAVAGWNAGVNQLYFVYTAPGEQICQPFQCFANGPTLPLIDAGCAYHDWYHQGPVGTGAPIIYAAMPYLGTGVCQHNGGPNGTVVDSEISVSSHEQMEAATDPELGSGWLNGSQSNILVSSEIGDQCAWDYGGIGLDVGQANVEMNGHYYLLQREWSNAANACVTSGPLQPTLMDTSPTSGKAGSLIHVDVQSAPIDAIVQVVYAPGAYAYTTVPLCSINVGGDGTGSCFAYIPSVAGAPGNHIVRVISDGGVISQALFSLSK